MRKEPHLVENTVIWYFGFGGVELVGGWDLNTELLSDIKSPEPILEPHKICRT
jgi:hypothetical protein